MRLIIDYPWYFVVLCLLIGAVYSALLYWRSGSDLGKGIKWLLAILRFVVVSLIALLLLAPLAKRTMNEQEKPIVLVVQDGSESIGMTKDSNYYAGEYAQSMQQVIEDLEKRYDVQTFEYGGETTDMSGIIEELTDQYLNRNVGAMVLTGDGIYNVGGNPATAIQHVTFPIYTVALGDTTHRCDALISDVRFNRIAYMGNQFPVEITVRASQLNGEKKRLSIVSGGKQLWAKDIIYEGEEFSTTERVMLDAMKPGIQQYEIRITEADGEISVRNNVRTFAVEVIDGHQKIAIIAAAPHPDVAALKQAIESNQNYEVTTMLAKDFDGKVGEYSLLILHQLPSQMGQDISVEKETPLIYIVGSQTDLNRLNRQHLGLEIYTRLNKTNDVLPMINKNFAPFTLSEETANELEKMPPLVAPFGGYKLNANMQNLMTARIGNVDSKLPMIAVGQQQSVRRAFIAGEGLWRWRIADYQATGGHEHFDELVNKLVVYTSIRVDKKRFHLTTKSIYRQDESVMIEAELYNENFEPINEPEVKVKVGEEEYTLNRSGEGYYLNLGSMPPDAYWCKATTKYNGEELVATSSFVVEELNLEELNLVANHTLMNTIAQTTGGEMIEPSQLEDLPKKLDARGDLKPIIYSHIRYADLLGLPWLLILIVVLLGVEWIVRKYNGEI